MRVVDRQLVSEHLLKIKLVLGKEYTADNSEDGLRGHFPCAEIADEYLPWDVNEIDW